jgi:hypothetical protein
MPRKRSDGSSNQRANGQSAPAPTKKEAVAAALAGGMTSPTEIAAHVNSAYGLDITTNYVSVIKGELGYTKKRKGRKPGRKPKTEQAAATLPAARPAPAPKEGGLTPQDLRALNDMASRVGGFDRLREFVDVLSGVR